MLNYKRTTLVMGATLATALWLLSGCGTDASTIADSENGTSGNRSGNHQAAAPTHAVESGTMISVALSSSVSSKTANVGDTWHGTVAENVATRNGGMIAAGSQVTGVVSGATPAKRGSRAMLDLAVRSIRVDGHDEKIAASAEPVIAGSTRARNLGAIAGSAAAGALIGKAVGDGKNATVGGIIGGATAAGVVATSDGFQVELKEGTLMNFTVSETVAMR